MSAALEYVASMVADIRASVLIALTDNGPMTASALRSFFAGSGSHTPMVLLHRALDALVAEHLIQVLERDRWSAVYSLTRAPCAKGTVCSNPECACNFGNS